MTPERGAGRTPKDVRGVPVRRREAGGVRHLLGGRVGDTELSSNRVDRTLADALDVGLYTLKWDSGPSRDVRGGHCRHKGERSRR